MILDSPLEALGVPTAKTYSKKLACVVAQCKSIKQVCQFFFSMFGVAQHSKLCPQIM